MAAVTVLANKHAVLGDRRKEYYVINIAASTDTLQTGLKVVEQICTNNPGAVTLVAPTQASGPNSTALLTFTTTGAVNNLLVSVEGF